MMDESLAVGGALPRQEAEVEAFKIRNVAQNRETSQRTTTDVITFDTATKWPGGSGSCGCRLAARS